MRTILILTQDINNLSVKQLAQAIQQQIKLSPDQHYRVLVCGINDVSLTPDSIKLNGAYGLEEPILFSDIALVIKRTWGPIRKKALGMCQDLEKNGVMVLNGCDFIEWSHSKIKQYETLKGQDIFPKTVCFEKPTPDVLNVPLEFPLIFKTNEGCRTDGVYLIESKIALENLINTLSQGNSTEFKSGFLLQEFIRTHIDPDISSYYRINLVNGRVQSAVQFQLKWTPVDNGTYKKLADFDAAEDKPISLNALNTTQLDRIVDACPSKNGAIGIDIVQDKDGSLFLLEFNDGPNISQVVALSEKYENKECRDFPNEIGRLCLDLVKSQDLAFNNAAKKGALNASF